MIETERNKRKTDRAWNTLYQRLDEEGLLSGRPASPFRSPAWKRGVAAAAVTLLCLLISVTYLNRSGQDTDPNLLTRQNSETATTLVTTLEDGSVVYLAGNTSLKFPEHFSSDRREVSLQGNALFDVAGNHKRPFIIETEDTRIEVLGTAFNVKSNDSTPFELSVQRGEVKVTLTGHPCKSRGNRHAPLPKTAIEHDARSGTIRPLYQTNQVQRRKIRQYPAGDQSAKSGYPVGNDTRAMEPDAYRHLLQ